MNILNATFLAISRLGLPLTILFSIAAASTAQPTVLISDPNPRMPAFSWDTIPRYIHVRKTAAFTDEEAKYLATFPLITFEKTTGTETYGATERGTIEAAKAVKRFNSDAKVLFYRNVIVHYGGYDFNDELSRIDSPFLLNKQGEDNLIRGRVKAYDLSNPRVIAWWVKSMADVCNDESIDGLFLDGNVKVLSSFLKNELPDGKKLQVTAGFEQLISQTRIALEPDKLMIANILRARFDNGGLEFIDPFDGSYLEGFEHPVAGVSRADYIAKGIRCARQAASQGKIIALTLGINQGSLSNGIDQQQTALRHVSDVSQSRIDYCVAMFLIIAERYSYLNIHDGYDVNIQGDRGSVSQLWMHNFPEYQRPLGPPQGPPKQDGYRYVREFEHAKVELDLQNERGVIQWN